MNKVGMFEKITVRLYPSQLQVLTELKEKLGCTYSLLVRTIIRDFIIHNEESLERILQDKEEEE